MTSSLGLRWTWTELSGSWYLASSCPNSAFSNTAKKALGLAMFSGRQATSSRDESLSCKGFIHEFLSHHKKQTIFLYHQSIYDEIASCFPEIFVRRKCHAGFFDSIEVVAIDSCQIINIKSHTESKGGEYEIRPRIWCVTICIHHTSFWGLVKGEGATIISSTVDRFRHYTIMLIYQTLRAQTSHDITHGVVVMCD